MHVFVFPLTPALDLMHDYPAIVRYWFYFLAIVTFLALVAMLFRPSWVTQDLLASALLSSVGLVGLSATIFGLGYGHVLERAGRTVHRKQSPGYFWFYLAFWLATGAIFGIIGLHALLQQA